MDSLAMENTTAGLRAARPATSESSPKLGPLDEDGQVGRVYDNF